MAGMAPEGSQFDAKHYHSKMQDLLNQGETEEFFTSYDEAHESFDDMGLQENLLRGIYAYGFEKPSAIQQRGIVPFCKGLDVIQQAQSGSGKTATFCSGILQQLDYGLVECQALVLAPTRELAQQIEKVVHALGDYLGVKVHACVGGTSVCQDQRILASGVHVVVGTPGCVFDMLRRQSLRPDNIKMFVLDEADEMLSRGFKDLIYDIFQLVPAKIQVGVFSATMPPEALEITRKFMNKPVRISGSGNEWTEACPPLQWNLRLLSHDEVELAKMLLMEGQMHLFEHWPEPGVDDNKKRSFFDQVHRLNSSYPGGLASYIQNARKLLADSKAGNNPYDGFTPSVPSGEVLTFGDDTFDSLEEAGVKEARHAAFVLVAGGLGERLGYKGIKVALPRETTTGKCFLQHYIESILALQEASCKMIEGKCHTKIPFVIMTSDDTNVLTINLLESNSYFGMEPSQVKILKQEKVACLADNDARLALDPNDKYKIQTKPHGHGDVHSLLYSSGLLEQWKSRGQKWVLFFQDTNGLLFNAIPSALGVSATKGYNVNSLAVPRKAKEAIGGITKLTHTDGRTMVINVEYNQLDPLLRATGHPDGDANCETGYSPYPGNINQLILELGPYIEELKKTHGAISEFVNPKYTDSTRTTFKSSTRLECMMQDYPKTLPPTAKVGFTVVDTWLAYAPVKNNPEDAAKIPKGNPYHSATSGEMAIYRANSLILRKAGAQIADPVVDTFNGQEVEVWPRITWSPRWGLAFKDVNEKVHGNSSVSQRSALVINGKNIVLEGLSLDGTLFVNSVDEAEVKVTGRVENKGWTIWHVDHKDTSEKEEIRIRGFKFQKVEQLELSYTEPGKHCMSS